MNKLLSTLFLALILLGCNRDQEILGPSLDELYGEFTVLEELQADRTRADFSTGQSITFTCRFSNTVDWELHVVGNSSGAEKIFTGKSKVLDEQSTLWDGTTTELPMFKKETCFAYVVVPEESYADTLLGLTIDSTRGTEGFVVADLESGINPGWTIFAQSGANMSFNVVNSDTAAQGNAFYDMGGEVTFDYLIGLLDFPASAYNGATAFPLNSNPEKVYFNVFLYKPAGINNEIVLFQFREDENGDGSYQASSEDMYSVELKGLEDGWQQVSIRYADMIALVNGQPASPAGNGVHEPHKLMQVSLLFLADPNSGYSQTYFDNIIFTENQAFQP